MTQYRRGYRTEVRARKLLEGQGYFVVRSAGSKGPVDLVAIKGKEVRLVQVKRTKGGVKDAVRMARGVEVPGGLEVEVWVWLEKERRFVVFVVDGG